MKFNEHDTYLIKLSAFLYPHIPMETIVKAHMDRKNKDDQDQPKEGML